MKQEDVVFADHLKTVGEVREYLKSVHVNGELTTCPCCNQLVKTYKRALNAPMSRILILISKYFEIHPNEKYLHVDNYLKRFRINCRYFSLLRFWDLIEPMPGDRADGSRRNGYWAITELGKRFAKGEIKVQKHIFMFNQSISGFSDQWTDIHDSLLSGGFVYQDIVAMF